MITILQFAIGVKRLRFCYYRGVRKVRSTRPLVVLTCVAVLVLCTAVSTSTAHLDSALPILPFCFLGALIPLVLRLTEAEPAFLTTAFLAVHISRAPPLA